MRKPNFIIILTDDQGYGDLSCMGSDYVQTPNLDKIAENGVLFTNWYSSAPVCSPSRASLLTGKYPANAGVRSILAGHRTATGLHPSVTTIASALKQFGYQTAMFGKWHLGVAQGSRPNDHGFDQWFGFLAGCIDYYSHIFYWSLRSGVDALHDLWENGTEVYDNGRYFTDLITERAVKYIRQSAKDSKPFFLYLPYNAPHYPMHAPKEYMERFEHLPWEKQIMAAMISAMDDGVGKVIDELHRQNIYENTFIFFMSDNGPSRETANWLNGCTDLYRGGTTKGLKGHKFSLYEGGIRVPAIMSWPERIPAGRIIDDYAIAMDIFPTIIKAVGGDAEQYEPDGVDIMDMVTNSGQWQQQREIFWEMDEQTAMRRGRYKLVLNGRLAEEVPPEDDIHLSDLEKDSGERENLKSSLSEVTSDMVKSAKSWRDNIEKSWREKFADKSNGTTTHSE